MQNKLIISGLIALALQNAWGADTYLKVKIAFYKNSHCAGKPLSTFEYNTAKSCNNYSYVDSKGVTTKGSVGHFRCYPDKLVYDKYPLNWNCHKHGVIYNLNYSVPGDSTKCQRAVSHEGYVYERLLNYKYPGNIYCIVHDKKK